MISIQEITTEETRNISIKYMSRCPNDIMIVTHNSKYQSYPINAASNVLDDLKTHVAGFKNRTVAFFRNANVFHLRNFTGFICLDAKRELTKTVACPIFYICECIEEARIEGYYAYYSNDRVIYGEPYESNWED